MYLVGLEQKCVHLVQVRGKVNEKRNCVHKREKNVLAKKTIKSRHGEKNRKTGLMDKKEDELSAKLINGHFGWWRVGDDQALCKVSPSSFSHSVSVTARNIKEILNQPHKHYTATFSLKKMKKNTCGEQKSSYICNVRDD